MEDSTNKIPVERVPKNALLAMFFGIGSIMAMLIIIPVSFFIEVIGASSLLRMIVIPLSVAAVILGITSRREIKEKGLPGWSQATVGLFLGAAALIVVVVGMVVITLFFSLLLFEKAAFSFFCI